MMNRIIQLIAIFSCLLLTGCISSNVPESSNQTSTTSISTVLTTSPTTGTTQYIDEQYYIDEAGVLIGRGKYYDMDWENMSEEIYKDDMIPNQETAVAVANVYLENMYDGKLKDQYVLYAVFYDEIDAVWIVTFATDLNNLGGDAYHFMIDKKTGEVLRAWYSVD